MLLCNEFCLVIPPVVFTLDSGPRPVLQILELETTQEVPVMATSLFLKPKEFVYTRDHYHTVKL